MASKTQDLGNAPVGKLLARLAVPAITAQLINALYNIVDRIYIGHLPGIGDTALTGVGVTFPIIMIIAAFASLIGMGGGPRASIKLGESDKDGAEKVLGNCFVLLLGISAALTVLFLVFLRPMLLLFGANEGTTLPYATDYMVIYVSGTLFVQIALGLNPFITTQGFATVSMMTVILGAVLNIALDPILMFSLNMGVRGAAVATVFSQAVSAVWVLCFLFGKRTLLRVRRKNCRLSLHVSAPVLALGLSPFMMQATESAVNIALNSSLKHYSSDAAVGAMTICSSLMQVAFMPMTGLAQGAQPIIGYNYGAGQYGRVKKTFRLLFLSCVTFSTALWLSLMLFPQIFVHLFNDEPQLTQIAVWALRIYMAGVFMLGVQTSCQQTFVAMGQAKVSLFLALLRKVVLLIPLILILPLFLEDKTFGIFLAEPVADIAAATVTGIVFAVYYKKLAVSDRPVKASG